MSVSYPTKLLLAFRNGDRCAFPGCGRELTVNGISGNPVVTGEAAHISGENPTAARYDESMTDQQRNHYNNLIYLCGDHHTQIDKQAADFSLEKLHQMKIEHVGKLRQAVNDAFSDIGFPELEEATEWVLTIQTHQNTSDFSLIPPEDKLKKNNLGLDSRAIITMALSVVRDVGAYVESVTQTDADFPDRLKVGFLSEYYRLRHEGYAGDDLFDLMCRFAQRGFERQAKRSAGIAVLVYLFEACEVFEK